MSNDVHAVVHFTDGTNVTLAWPAQAGEDRASIARKVRNALEMDKFMAEVEGDMIIIPMQNIKYVMVTPAPQELPQSVLRNAHIVG